MAENKEGQEKTEPATAKRLHEARMRGQVAKSLELTTAAVMLFGGLAVFILGKPLMENFTDFMKQIFHQSWAMEITFDNINHYYFALLVFLAKILIPIIMAIFIISLVPEISQVGFKIANKKFTEGLNWKQVFNPFSGIKKIFFSTRSLFELVKSVVKLLVLGIIAYQVLSSYTIDTIKLIEKDVGSLAILIVQISLELIIKLGIAYLFIAFADFMYQKYKFKEDMKMTRQEIKDEFRQTEGDPKIKARIKQMMRSRIRKIMLENVKKADVVITNPTHFAVALKYDSNLMNAPKVTAKGVDFLAQTIKEIANENEVPIIENPPLARTLYYNVEIEQEIPENLFKAVAQVLAYVYSLKERA